MVAEPVSRSVSGQVSTVRSENEAFDEVDVDRVGEECKFGSQFCAQLLSPGSGSRWHRIEKERADVSIPVRHQANHGGFGQNDPYLDLLAARWATTLRKLSNSRAIAVLRFPTSAVGLRPVPGCSE
jgi:hypothetical protein